MQADELKKAGQEILAGRLVVFPTETFYGLAACPHQAPALQRLIELKGRGDAKGIPLIASDIEVVLSHFVVPTALEVALRQIWPAPLTMALAPRKPFPKVVSGDFESVAVRVPKHDLARKLAQHSGGLITATSANRSGEPPVRNSSEIHATLLGGARLVEGPGELTQGGQPSTIVALEDGHIRVYREGSFDPQRFATASGLPCLPWK